MSNKIYSVFPFLTFLNREGYLLNCMNGKTGRALREFSAAGYKTLDVHWYSGDMGKPAWISRTLYQHWRAGDAVTWVMTL
jgi:hypothetical protein